MLRNLTNLSYTRSYKEAVIFYSFYSIILTLLAMMTAGLIAFFTDETIVPETIGLVVGNTVSVLSAAVLSSTILWKKSLLRSFYILLVPVSIILAFFGGGVLGLIPVAYVTTVKNGNSGTTSPPSPPSTEQVETPQPVVPTAGTVPPPTPLQG